MLLLRLWLLEMLFRGWKVKNKYWLFGFLFIFYLDTVVIDLILYYLRRNLRIRFWLFEVVLLLWLLLFYLSLYDCLYPRALSLWLLLFLISRNLLSLTSTTLLFCILLCPVYYPNFEFPLWVDRPQHLRFHLLIILLIHLLILTSAIFPIFRSLDIGNLWDLFHWFIQWL